MPNCPRQEISTFLQDLKEQVSKAGLLIIPRGKNTQAMVRLNMTRDQVAGLTLNLVVEDYHKGPEADHHNAQNEVWIFGPVYDRQAIYLKFLDSGFGPARRISCYSIHEAEQPLTLPCQ